MARRPPAPLPSHPDVELESDTRVWSGLFPIDLVKFRHRRFDGAMSPTRTWELWRRGPAAAMIPYDPWSDRVVLIEQFRLPALAAGLDPVLVELPAGLCDAGESAETTIRREIQEEMRLTADLVEPVGTFLLTPGGADETCDVFVGRVRAPPAGPDGIAWHAGEASESEDIRVRVWDADEAIAAAFARRFTNIVTALGLFWLASRRAGLRQQWKTA
ncbi:MAG: NUDIX domain-containing protein [Proteobacteria bacterium]|nr:NUDIX domain-containing protein [Pseudomonadota bacterium]